MENSTTRTFICDACRQIDFRKGLLALEMEDRWREGILLDSNIRRFMPFGLKKCALCKLLSTLVCQHHNSQPPESTLWDTFQLRAFGLHDTCSWVPDVVLLKDLYGNYFYEDEVDCFDVEDSVHLRVVSASTKDRSCSCLANKAGYVVCYFPDKVNSGLFKPQIIPKLWDSSKARLWINNCTAEHGSDCTVPQHKISQMKVIDCEAMEIISADMSMQWVALSYVWGKQGTESTSFDTAHLKHHLSPTIRDAIIVTKDLGYRYLWVDQYCINQVDAAVKLHQIRQMDSIYEGASLTIVAAVGENPQHGLPGVGSTLRSEQDIVHLHNCTILSTSPDPFHHIQNSRWWKRGWTFQEGCLSRRLLIFTEYQTYFECNTIRWMEAIGGLEFLESARRLRWESWQNGPTLLGTLMTYDIHQPSAPRFKVLPERRADWKARIQEVFRLVEAYSLRELSFDSDSLNAFTGIMTYLEKYDPPTRSLVGLPYIVEEDIRERYLITSGQTTLHELFEARLVNSLCWYHISGCNPRRRPEFPSWTWAGWAGPIRWSRPFSNHNFHFIHELRNLRIEDNNGLLLPPLKFLQACDTPTVDLAKAIAFSFEAPSVPYHLFSLANPESKPDSEDWSNWTVSSKLLAGKGRMPERPGVFLKHLQMRQWECFLVGSYTPQPGQCEYYLLTVEWLDDVTARRVGALLVLSETTFSRGGKSHDRQPPFWDMSDQNRKTVRLI